MKFLTSKISFSVLVLWAFSLGCVGTDIINDSTDNVPDMMGQGDGRSGMFVKRPGTAYNVTGTVTLQDQPNGKFVLNFGEDFSCSNGPGLAVFLSTINGRGSSSLNLGDLQKTSGAQSYPIPDNVEPGAYNWVVIHCVPFNVTFGYAELNE